MSRVALFAAPFILALAAACVPGASDAAPPLIRLLDLPAEAWRFEPAPAARPGVEVVALEGIARPALRLEPGTVASCEVVLPAEPCWLDVEAAAVAAAAPPSKVVLEVSLQAGAATRLLHRAILQAGTHPGTAGFGHARIELLESLGERVTLRFRLAPEASADAAGRSCLLAQPRIAPRVGGDVRPWTIVWCESGPAGASATGSGEREPAVLAVATAVRGIGFETEWFGAPVAAADGRVVAKWSAFDRVELGPTVAERPLFLEVARPKAAGLFVAVTLPAKAERDAAVERLTAHLRAHELLDRTLLIVRDASPSTPAEGVKEPPRWRELAPAFVQEGFEAALAEAR